MIGLFFKHKVPGKTWIGIVFALVGLYLLCMKDEVFSLGIGDIYLLLCALCYSIQIMLVDHFVQKTDPISLSALQFFFCGIFSGIVMLQNGIPNKENLVASLIPLLYTGVVSTGIGFTFQVLGQKDVPAPLASLVMSLESVIATLAGWLILREVLSTKEMIGCALVFIAILLTQLPGKKRE